MIGEMDLETRLAFLAQAQLMTLGTVDQDGLPHLAPLWFGIRPGGVLVAWTRARLRKVHNLERDPRATVLVHDGVGFDEIRGVLMRCTVTLERNPEAVAAIGREILGRYVPADAPGAADREALVRAQAAVRVGLVLKPVEVSSWDHRTAAEAPPPTR